MRFPRFSLFLLASCLLGLLLFFTAPVGATPSPQGDFDCAAVTEIPLAECQALVTLYNSTNGPAWITRTNWLVTSTPCGWYGVTCTGNRITTLVLATNQLTGQLPAELGNLGALQRLELYQNSLNGPIPAQLGNLQQLTNLRLDVNALSGPIPPELGGLSSILRLNLMANQLSGPIPPELGNLRTPERLMLNSNALTGPIPPELGQIASLSRLWLDNNQLSGPIPSQLSTLTNLRELALQSNLLKGEIPATLTNLTRLRSDSCTLGYNGLTSSNATLRAFLDSRCPGWSATQTVAPTNFQATPLSSTAVRVSWTPIAYTADPGGYEIDLGLHATGSFTRTERTPTKNYASFTIQGLTPSTKYVVRAHTVTTAHEQQANELHSDYTPVVIVETPGDNEFGCAFVTELPLADCEALVALYENTNGPNWTGIAKPWLEGLTPCSTPWDGIICVGGRVNKLSLSAKNLVGVLPPKLGDLTQLTELRLDHNELSGGIPTQLGNLTALTQLDLSHNQLAGAIPTQLGGLTKLVALKLTNNELTGSIPAQLGAITTLDQLYLDSNRLEGNLPSELGALVNLDDFNVAYNQLNGEIPASYTNLTNLSPSPSRTHLGYNRLFSNNAAVRQFLAQKDPDWETTQTIRPATPTVTAPVYNTVRVNWTPILYTGDGGGYELCYSLTASFSSPTCQMTAGKATSSFSFTNLTGETTYFVRLRVYTPSHSFQKNELWTQYTQIVSATTPERPHEACLNVTGIPAAECEVLLEFFASTGGTNWSNRSGWFTSNTPCSDWYGIVCASGQIRELRLPGNGLAGPLPGALTDLTALTVLDLSNNSLSNAIPSDLASLTSLRILSLHNNLFNGAIPPQLGGLTNLQQLTLHNNLLSGALPPELGNLSKLTHLQLSNNQFSGPLPPELSGLTSLTHFEAAANQFNGDLPIALLGLCQNASVFAISYNRLSASAPALQACLDARNPGWLATQTLSPTNLRVVNYTANSLDLSWTPIAYQSDGGYYRISYAQQSSGPFTAYGDTPNKAANTFRLEGLNPETIYYIQVQSYTPAHSGQQNPLWSEPPATTQAQTRPICYLLDLTYVGEGEGPTPIPPKSGECAADQTYRAGVVVQLIARPAPNWTVERWFGTDQDLYAGTVNTVTMPAQLHRAGVVYQPPCFSLTLVHTGNGADPIATPGASSGCPAGKYEPGETIGLRAAPEAGWFVASWEGADAVGGTMTNTLIMPAESHLVRVNYSSKPCHPLTLTHEGEGANPTAQLDQSDFCSPGHYNAGEEIALIATPGAGQSVSGWRGTSNDASKSVNNQVIMPDQAHTATVLYTSAAIPCHLLTLLHEGPGGRPQANPAQSADCQAGHYVEGEIVYLNADPNPGAKVERWEGVADAATNQPITQLSMPRQPHTVMVIYTADDTPQTGQEEPNNTCGDATAIQADGTPKESDFYSSGDIDWFSFEAAAQVTYTIHIEAVAGSAADVIMQLYPNCTSVPTSTQDRSFSPDVWFRFPSFSAGQIYFQLSNRPGAAINAASPTNLGYRITIHASNLPPQRGALIIVAGKLSNHDDLQENIAKVTNEVRDVFLGHGYDDDRIYYLAPSSDRDLYEGADAGAQLHNLEQAITQWAVSRVDANRPLTLYLMDHGGRGRFYLDATLRPPQVLTPQQLDGWLDTLQEQVPGLKINLIIEACYAGSFLTPPTTVAGPGRVVMTSTGANVLAWSSPPPEQGAVFSDHFLDALKQGETLYAAFVSAQQAARIANAPQVAELDSDGDGIPNEADDRIEAQRRGFAISGTLSEQWLWRPWIRRVTPPAIDEHGSGKFVAEVRDDHEIQHVWAVVYPPSYQPPGEELEELQSVAQPVISGVATDGEPATGRYFELTFPNFTEIGVYRIVIYARDNEELAARPVELAVRVGSQLYLPLVQK